jgi:hypothetical protein
MQAGRSKENRSTGLNREEIRGQLASDRLSVCLGFENFSPTIKTSGADVMTQVRFACGGLNRGTRGYQKIVITVVTALGRGFFILLDGHK